MFSCNALPDKRLQNSTHCIVLMKRPGFLSVFGIEFKNPDPLIDQKTTSVQVWFLVVDFD